MSRDTGPRPAEKARESQGRVVQSHEDMPPLSVRSSCITAFMRVGVGAVVINGHFV